MENGSSDQSDVHSGDDWTFPTGQQGTYYCGTEQTITNTIAISQALRIILFKLMVIPTNGFSKMVMQTGFLVKDELTL